MLAVLTVNSSGDTHVNTTDNALTLREAIEVVANGTTTGLNATAAAQIDASANPLGTNDTINFASSLSAATITLSRATTFGQLEISKALVIDGASLGITILADDPTPHISHTDQTRGDGIRIFNITDPSMPIGTAPPTVKMVGLTLKNADPALSVSPDEPFGGAIFSQCPLILQNMTITDNEAGEGAAVYVNVEGGGSQRTALTIQDSTIDYNSASSGGGAAYVLLSMSTSNDAIAASGSELSHNTAGTGNGGALLVDGNFAGSGSHDTVTISSTCTFADNHAGNAGGAVFVQTNAVARVDLSLQQSTLSGNTANGSYGGGLYFFGQSGSSLTIQDSTISGNFSARHGGGLYALGSGHAQFAILGTTKIQNNTAGGFLSAVGGAANIQLGNYSSLDIEDCTISGNKALGSSAGGGLYLRTSDGSTATIQDSTITGNTASDGGGIHAYAVRKAASIDIEHTTIGTTDPDPQHITDRNIAAANGGGIWARAGDDGTISIKGNSTVAGNRANGAGDGGGGIWARVDVGGALNIDHSTVSGNTAYAGSGSNNGSGNGGGLFAEQFGSAVGSAVTISNSTISGNTAVNRGAGVYSLNGGGTETLIQDSTITGNTVPVGAHGFPNGGAGGGVYAQLDHDSFPAASSPKLTITGSTIDHNKTDLHGGGVFVLANIDGIFTATNSMISSNQTLDATDGQGGGIFITQWDVNPPPHTINVTLDDVMLTGNTAAVGGGIYAYLNDDSMLDVENNSIVAGNTATLGDGGGIFAEAFANPIHVNLAPTSSAVQIMRSTISNNKAGARGGGMYVVNHAGTKSLVKESWITGNEAGTSTTALSRSGGGIYAFESKDTGGYSPSLTITGSTADSNRTFSKGGGVYVVAENDGVFAATNSTFYANQATDTMAGQGGGIYFTQFNNSSNPSHTGGYLVNDTITQNIAPFGGGLRTEDAGGIVMDVANTIISQNYSSTAKTTASDAVGRFDIANFQYNLIGTGSSLKNLDGSTPTSLPFGNMTSDSPGLTATLEYRGGFAPLAALLPNSPAIDAGSNTYDVDLFTGKLMTDQRGTGFLREFDVPGYHDPGAITDIGAYEVNAPKIIGLGVGSTIYASQGIYWMPAGSGEQLRTVPIGNANEVIFQFSEPISGLQKNDLTMQSAITQSSYDVSGSTFTYNSASNTATWVFGTAFYTDQIVISLAANGTDAFGNALDGDWTNPTTLSQATSHNWPSGDGSAGGTFVFHITILPGDANRDNVVNGSDIGVVILYWQQSSAKWIIGDVDGNGTVNGADIGLVILNWQVAFVNFI